MYDLTDYDYDLPESLIAQYPAQPRDSCRLMVVDRATGTIRDAIFYELADLVQEGDRFIFNDTRVIPARLKGQRVGGGASEVFLLRPFSEDIWEVIARPNKKLPAGAIVTFGQELSCEFLEGGTEGCRRARFQSSLPLQEAFKKIGRVPLPPYIRGGVAEKRDEEDYQTIFATHLGAIAAPTAGLHFSEGLLATCRAKGVSESRVTLHVGLGTFKSVETRNIRDHQIHAESYFISPEAATQLNTPVPGRSICVGTTTCRTLEAASESTGKIQSGRGESRLFIYPGYQFRYVSSLLTNFHLPRSSLLMLVAALMGYDLMREAYKKAIVDGYRFYSYGDAMLII